MNLRHSLTIAAGGLDGAAAGDRLAVGRRCRLYETPRCGSPPRRGRGGCRAVAPPAAFLRQLVRRVAHLMLQGVDLFCFSPRVFELTPQCLDFVPSRRFPLGSVGANIDPIASTPPIASALSHASPSTLRWAFSKKAPIQAA